MSSRPLVPLVVAVAAVLALSGTGCAGDEGGSSDDGRAPAIPCPARELTAESDQLAVAVAGPVAFVDGAEAASSSGGHTHTGPLVGEGEAHLHYCLVVANGYDESVVITAIQVLPDASEEPLAIVEAGPLVESFEDRRQAEQLDGGEQAVLELLVPADGPVDELHQRIAYTVEFDEGPLDLFADLTLPA